MGLLLEQIAQSSRVREVPRAQYRNLDSSIESADSMDPAALAALNSQLAKMQMNLSLYSHEFQVRDKGNKKIVLINTLGKDNKASSEKSTEFEMSKQQGPLNVKLTLPERWADEVTTAQPKPDNSDEVLTNTGAISSMKAQPAEMELDKVVKLPDDSKKQTNDATTIEMESTTARVAEREEQLKPGQQPKTVVSVSHEEVEGLERQLDTKRGQLEELKELEHMEGQANEEGQQQIELQQKVKLAKKQEQQRELQQIDRPEAEREELKKLEKQEKPKQQMAEKQPKQEDNVQQEQSKEQESQVAVKQMSKDLGESLQKADPQEDHQQLGPQKQMRREEQDQEEKLKRQEELQQKEGQQLQLDQQKKELKKGQTAGQQEIEKQPQMKGHQPGDQLKLLQKLKQQAEEKLEPLSHQLQLKTKPKPKPLQNVADAHAAVVDATEKDDSHNDNDGPATGMNMSGKRKLELKPEPAVAVQVGPTAAVDKPLRVKSQRKRTQTQKAKTNKPNEIDTKPNARPSPTPTPTPTRKLMTVGQTADVKATTEISSQDTRKPMQKGQNGPKGQKATKGKGNGKGKGKRRPTDEQEIETTTNWWQILPYAEIRKFLNTIYDSIADDDADEERAQRLRPERGGGAGRLQMSI